MRNTTLALLFALLCPLAARAQSTTPPVSSQSTQQSAKPNSTLDDDPGFKRLTPEKQELVRKAMQNIDNAIADDRKNPANPDSAKPRLTVSPVQAGCDAAPLKKPRFRIPKAVQDAINKQTRQIGSKTGVDLDPNAPPLAVKDAQKQGQGNPCPPSPAPAQTKPANK